MPPKGRKKKWVRQREKVELETAANFEWPGKPRHRNQQSPSQACVCRWLTAVTLGIFILISEPHFLHLQ